MDITSKSRSLELPLFSTENAGTTASVGIRVYQRKWATTPVLSTLPSGPNAPLDTGSGSTTTTIFTKNVSLIGSVLMSVSPVMSTESVCLVKTLNLTSILSRSLMTTCSVKIALITAFLVRDPINFNATATKINSKELQFMILYSDFAYLGSLALPIVLIVTKTESVQNAQKIID
jgi:hypothetical protein